MELPTNVIALYEQAEKAITNGDVVLGRSLYTAALNASDAFETTIPGGSYPDRLLALAREQQKTGHAAPPPTSRSSNNSTAGSVSDAILSLAGQPPVVVETYPTSGAQDVSPGETEIRVRFSKPMADGSWSWSSAWENSMPESLNSPHYLPDHRTCVMKVRLEPGRTYAWWLNSEQFKNFRDRAGQPAVPYLLTFHTKSN